MKIFICGDSFASDFSVKYSDYLGWPNLLAKDHIVTNLAQAGIGPHKILKQIEKAGDLNNYDLILISHCSPWRLATIRHPVHHNDPLHYASDLIFSDIDYHMHNSKVTPELQAAYDFFKYHFDKDYHDIVCKLFRDEINKRLNVRPTWIVNFRKHIWATEPNIIDFSHLTEKKLGLINHLSEDGNQEVYTTISNVINNQ